MARNPSPAAPFQTRRTTPAQKVARNQMLLRRRASLPASRTDLRQAVRPSRPRYSPSAKSLGRPRTIFIVSKLTVMTRSRRESG
jgi:hypothetical protein